MVWTVVIMGLLLLLLIIAVVCQKFRIFDLDEEAAEWRDRVLRLEDEKEQLGKLNRHLDDGMRGAEGLLKNRDNEIRLLKERTTELVSKVHQATKERDTARDEVERVRDLKNTILREKTEALGLIADLRGEISRLRAAVKSPEGTDGPSKTGNRRRVKTAAKSPA